MQIFRSLVALVAEQEARHATVPHTDVASEPLELDEALLERVSGGVDAPGNGW
jgi:hypothetical protein